MLTPQETLFLLQFFASLQPQSITRLSQITFNAGDITAGRFISPLPTAKSTEPTSTDFTGSFMSGIGELFGGELYNNGGVQLGVLQWGAKQSDGQLYAGGGDVIINQYGILFRNQEGELIFQDTAGGSTMAMYSDGANWVVIHNSFGGVGVSFLLDDASHNVAQIDFTGDGNIYLYDGDIDLAEGAYLLNGVNIFEVMGTEIINTAIPHDGWITVTGWTRTGNHVFTVGGDQTTIYRKGAKVRYKDGGAYEYGVVFTASHAAGTTTITLVTNTNFAMAAATLTDTYISYIEDPEGFPAQFDWTPTHSRVTTNYTNVPTVTFAKWKCIGTRLFFREQHQQNATPGGTGYQKFTLPVTPDATSSISRMTGNGMNLTAGYGLVVFVAEGEGARIFKYDATAEAVASNFYFVNGEFEL